MNREAFDEPYSVLVFLSAEGAVKSEIPIRISSLTESSAHQVQRVN